MTVRKIRLAPDPVLRQQATKVRTIDKSVQKLIDDMIDTLHSVPGVGLAAPQVGVSLRVCVIALPPKKDGEEKEDICLINPEIVKKSGERIIEEGCLSIPGYIGTVKRATSVTVKGKNRIGKDVRYKASGLLAQAFEHEINHLNGILYIDQLEGMDKPRKIRPEELHEDEPEDAE